MIAELLLILAPKHAEATGEGPPILEVRGGELRLHCPGRTGVERALEAVNCLRGELPLLVTRQCYTRRHLPGEPLASILYDLILRGETELAEAYMESAGAVAAAVHARLERCPRKPATCDKVIEERLELARRMGLEPSLETSLEGPGSCPSLARGHGDLHLYQFITSADRVEIVDFSGEPGTRTTTPACYDIATVARSLDYIASIVEVATGTPCKCVERLFKAFLEGYESVRDPPPTECLEACCVARAYYEYYYEKTASTGLEWIPERALKRAKRASCIWGTG